MFGCGLAFMAIFAGLAVAGPDVTLWLPATILPLLTVVAGGPHYGATLPRAYERKEDANSFEGASALAPFPPFYIAQFVDALPLAGRRERAIAVLDDGLRKFPQDPELGRARRARSPGAP